MLTRSRLCPAARCWRDLALASALRKSQPSILLRSFASYPPHTILELPALSPTMNTGGLASWKKRVGDTIEVGDALAEIETDKATMMWDSTSEGYFAKILVEAGARDVPVGKPVAVVCDKLADLPAFENFVLTSSAAPAQASPTTEAPSAATSEPTTAKTSTGVPPQRPSPAASAVMRSNPEIDFSVVSGSGRKGIFTKGDALHALKQGVKKPAGSTTASYSPPPPTPVSISPPPQPVSISSGLTLSSKSEIPHFYLTVDCTVDSAVNICESSSGVKLVDVVALAASKALEQVPDANASWTPEATRVYFSPDVVLNEGGVFGTIANPIQLRLAQVAAARESLFAATASPKADTGVVVITVEDEVEAPKLPIAASRTLALGVGRVHQAVLPASNAAGYVTVKRASVSLGCDHRVVDGVLGAQYLQAFKKYLEQPGLLI